MASEPGRTSPSADRRPRVLVTDDNAGLVELCSYILDDAGYAVSMAHSGAEALVEARRNAVDVAILDLQLPDCNGLDLLRTLREEDPRLEAVIITGNASLDTAIRALDSGAYSYLVKPVSPEDLRVQVQRALERRRLLEEREEHLRELEEAYRRERRIAETLQRWLIGEMPDSLPGGIRVAGRYQAALDEAEVGGDFYDVFPLGPTRLGLLMGDVSGKGLDAARYTALAKHLIYAYALEAPDPQQVMERVSLGLMERAPIEAFVTLFFGVLDVQSGHLAYASAGHEPALLCRQETGVIERLESTGPPAGAFPGVSWEAGEARLRCGDTLLLYTDGATDARHGDHWLHTDGLERVFRQSLCQDPEQTLERLHQAILRFASGRLRDDIALLLVRRDHKG